MTENLPTRRSVPSESVSVVGGVTPDRHPRHRAAGPPIHPTFQMSSVVEASGGPASVVFVAGQALSHGATQVFGDLRLPRQQLPELATPDDVDDDVGRGHHGGGAGRLSSRAISP